MFRELDDSEGMNRLEAAGPDALCECGCVEPRYGGDEGSPMPGKSVNDVGVHWIYNG